MNFIAVLLVLAGIGLSVLVAGKKNSMGKGKKIAGIMIVCCFVAYILASVVIIDAGDRGAVFNIFKGVLIDKELGEGTHIVPKILNRVVVYDVYTQTITEKIECLSSDGLPMGFDVSIRFRVNSEKVSNILQNVGTSKDVIAKILSPTVRSKMRDVAAEYTAQDAYAKKRAELQEEYKSLLKVFFESEDYLIAEQILVREVTPPGDLIAKIQETKVAEQEVIKQKNILAAEKMKKEQEIIKAEAIAKALQIKGMAIAKSPQIIAKEWIDKWDGALPTFMMGDSKGIMINMGEVMKKSK